MGNSPPYFSLETSTGHKRGGHKLVPTKLGTSVVGNLVGTNLCPPSSWWAQVNAKFTRALKTSPAFNARVKK